MSPPALSMRGLERAGARFSADVETITSGLVGGRWADWPGAVSRVSYHLDQLKTAAGWRTQYSAIQTAEPDGKTKGHPARLPSLARVEVDETGVVSMFDEAGARVSLPDRLPESIRKNMSAGSKGKNQADAIRARLSAMGPPRGNRETRLSGLVVDRAAQQSLIAELRSRGRVVGHEGSRKRYRLALEKGELEIAVDSSLGAIIEISSGSGSIPATRATYDYVATPSGQLVRTLLRTERQVEGSAAPFVSETRISNIRFGEEVGP